MCVVGILFGGFVILAEIALLFDGLRDLFCGGGAPSKPKIKKEQDDEDDEEARRLRNNTFLNHYIYKNN